MKAAGNKNTRKGFRNHYRSNMPWTEVLIKDMKSIGRSVQHLVQHGKTAPVMVCYPDLPSKRTTIHKIADRLGFRITNKIHPSPALFMWFDDSTHSDLNIPSALSATPCINEQCRDISKARVDQVHLDVFGYNTFIDPTRFEGAAVAKSDENARHDGRVIQCPINEKESGAIYQLLLENTYSDRFVVDHRVPVMAGEIPLVYRKFKVHDQRFTNEVDHSTLHSTADLFTPREVRLIAEFCKQMGADFCELDVIRNNLDGKIYIIDVNKTPYGPPVGLSEEDKKKAVETLSDCFRRNFLQD